MSFILKPLILIMVVVICPSIETAMFYFNTTALNFDTTQMTIINVLSQIGSIFGQQFYCFFLSNYTIKQLLLSTTVAYSLISCLRLLITTNVIVDNVDYFTYLISWLYSYINALHLMPIMVLACDMCPSKIEATFYSFVLALINLAYLISYDSGGWLMTAFSITSTSFVRLSWLVVVQAVYPLVNIPFILWFVPNK